MKYVIIVLIYLFVASLITMHITKDEEDFNDKVFLGFWCFTAWWIIVPVYYWRKIIIYIYNKFSN